MVVNKHLQIAVFLFLDLFQIEQLEHQVRAGN